MGEGDRYRFRVEVVEQAKERVGFADIFKDYARSINQPTPTFVRRVSISHTSLISTIDTSVGPSKRVRRRSTASVEEAMPAAKRLKMTIDPSVVQRESSLGEVRVADQRANSLGAFGAISGKRGPWGNWISTSLSTVFRLSRSEC